MNPTKRPLPSAASRRAPKHRFTRIRKRWARLCSSQPGHRFQNYSRQARREINRDELAPHVLRLTVATVLFLVGLCLMFFPIIYVPFFLMSAALFASESLPFARLLDRSEFWFRSRYARITAKAGLSQRTVRCLLVTLSVGCLVLTGCVYYNAFLR